MRENDCSNNFYDSTYQPEGGAADMDLLARGPRRATGKRGICLLPLP